MVVEEVDVAAVAGEVAALVVVEAEASVMRVLHLKSLVRIYHYLLFPSPFASFLATLMFSENSFCYNAMFTWAP